MQIVFYGDNLHEMSILFSVTNKKNNISKYRLVDFSSVLIIKHTVADRERKVHIFISLNYYMLT